MPGVGFLHGIHRESTNRVDRQRGDVIRLRHERGELPKRGDPINSNGQGQGFHRLPKGPRVSPPVCRISTDLLGCEICHSGDAAIPCRPRSIDEEFQKRLPVMIPAFDDNGYLPAGLHPATLAEVAVRFGTESEVRRVQLESLRWLVDLAQRAGVERLVVNGSFTTDVLEPNDVDCVLLIGANFPSDADAEREILDGLPFLEIQLVRPARFLLLVESFFATDRYSISKGMIEVLL